jgi:heptosyltransferase II
MRELLIVAPNWLGDAVMALPAVADLRRHADAARITVAARGAVAALFRLVPGVDRVITLPGKGGMLALRTWGRDAAALSGDHFECAVLFPNSFASALVTRRAGVVERWGFATDARSRLLTRAVPRPPSYGHQAEYYQALTSALGAPSGPRFARVDVDGAATASARSALQATGIDADEPFVALAPGAAYGRAKQWLPEHYAELATRLTADRGVPAVLVGSAADHPVCADIARIAHGARVANLAGATDVPALAATLALAAAVVANDSGAMHVAAAVGSPVVAVFGATNEHRTSPLVRGPHAPAPAILTSDVWCRPCMLRECPIDHRCMRGVTVDMVLARIVENHKHEGHEDKTS